MYRQIRRAAFRALNRMLGTVNLEVRPVESDFDGRLLDQKHLDILFRRLAISLDDWFSKQTLFPCAERPDFEAEVAAFYQAFLVSPFRRVGGGSRFNNLLWLAMVAKCYAPEIIIDSGTFRGASAWALSLAAPRAKVYSFDIDLSRLDPVVSGPTFLQQDWSTYPFDVTPKTRVLAYFDDHLDQARRLLEAAKRGVEIAIFDDDFPITSFAAMAPSALPLPKIEFLLDRDVDLNDEFRWMSGGSKLSWRPDRELIDRARKAIESTERLPNTSLVTGIHQTPYRIIKVRRPAVAT